MKLTVCFAVMLAVSFPRHVAAESPAWGGETGSVHDLWGWLDHSGACPREEWEALSPGAKNKSLKEAEKECGLSGAAVDLLLNGGDGDEMLAVPVKRLEWARVCLPERAGDAAAAARRRAKLAGIVAAYKQGKLDPADIAWLQEEGIRAGGGLEREDRPGAAGGKKTAGDGALLKPGKKMAAAGSYSKKGEAGLAGLYDGADRKGAGPDGLSAPGIKGKTAALPLAARGPQAVHLAHTPPPAPERTGAAAQKSAARENPVERKSPPPFPEKDVAELDKVVQRAKAERLAKGHTLGSWGNFKQALPWTKSPADGTGSGCRDWSEEISMAINKDPATGKKYEAGVLCGAKVPYLAQHCVAVFYPKGAKPAGPETKVWYYDAWAPKTRSGPVEDQLCSNPVPLEQDYTSKWPFGQVPTGAHHISYYGLEVSGPPGTVRKISGHQTNVLFGRGCSSAKK